MKSKSKLFTLLVLIFLTFLTSCSDDIYINENAASNSKIKSYSISFEEFNLNSNAKNSFNQFKAKQQNLQMSFNLQDKIIYNHDYNFYIDTDKVIVLENDNIISYTFATYNDSDANTVKNLVINSKNNQVFETFLIEYDLNQTEVDLILSGTDVDIDVVGVYKYSGDSTPCFIVSSEPVDYNEQGAATYGAVILTFAPCGTPGATCPPGACGGGGGGDGGDVNSSNSASGYIADFNTGTSGFNGYENPNNYQVPGSGTYSPNAITTPNISLEQQQIKSFMKSLTTQQYNFLHPEIDLNNLTNYDYEIFNEIIKFLKINLFSNESKDYAVQAITDLMNNECVILPKYLDPAEVTAPYDPDIFGDSPAPAVQQDHDAIQQQFNNLRNTTGDLAAVNYLITTYNMNTFGSAASINFNYTITFENGLSNGAHANAIRGYTNGIMTSCKLEIDINLFSSVDFGYITRVIKHELLHILQGITYGQYGVSVAAQEFDAYYLQIFGFKELKAISNASIQFQLAKKMITYMKQLTSSEKLESEGQIDKVKLIFTELCKN